MKLSALHQSYLNRRSNSFRSSPPLDAVVDGSGKSPAALFWVVIHCLCCLISLVLGFRFSRLVFFLLVSTSSTAPFRSDLPENHLDVGTIGLNLEHPPLNETATSSRVVVGRHGIRIRPWPHPNPVELMKAHQIIERVQREQRTIFGVKSPRRVIAITPTYVRTFQALHLTGVMHSLMLVPYDLVWIVVEAGGATNETASIISKSGVKTIHIGLEPRMPNTWEGRSKLEVKMRLHALRIVKEEKLDGIVMFMDDSNMHSMELFDEIQTVKWFGAMSVGILTHSSNMEEMFMSIEENPSLPIQGPACNSSNKLIGWHTFNTFPYAGKTAVYIDDIAAVMPQKLEWSGFVLNSKLLWEDAENKPKWVEDFESLNENIDSPLALVKDLNMVEPLGSCGRNVMLWWLRVEARADSKFPLGWMIDPPLEITVPAKRTPWPDTPPDNKPAITSQENAVVVPKHSTKTRRSKRRSKRKHEPKPIDTQISSKNHERN